jgi:hypothetical protein
MSYEYHDGKLIIDLNSDAGDEIVLAALKSARLGILESINNDYSSIARDGDVPRFRTENIKNNHEYLEAFEKVIEYFGGSSWDF